MFVVILGAGPAGMTCANALHTFGIESLVLERDTVPGGAQRNNFHPNLWLLGAPEETGREVTERMVRHFASLPIPLHVNAELARLRHDDARLRLTYRAGTADAPPVDLEADALVIATGTRPHATPALWALAEASPRVIVGPLSDAIRDDIRGARVLILGGGDNALDHALFLASLGNRVTTCTRGLFTARPGFIEACAAAPDIELRSACTARALHASLDAVQADFDQGSEQYDWLLVMYGYRPNVEVITRFEASLQPRLSASGHIACDRWQRTSVDRVYAAGDVTETLQPSMASAFAQGLCAARAIERQRA